MNLDLRSYVNRVENFSLVGKRRTDRVQHGQTLCLLLSLYKCCQVAIAPYERIHMQHLFEEYLRSTMTQEWLNHIAVTSCHSEIVKKLDSNPREGGGGGGGGGAKNTHP